MADSPSTESQSQPQFATPGGPANLSLPQSPHYMFAPFHAPGANGERSGSNPNLTASQLEAQRKVLKLQIEVLFIVRKQMAFINLIVIFICQPFFLCFVS